MLHTHSSRTSRHSVKKKTLRGKLQRFPIFHFFLRFPFFCIFFSFSFFCFVFPFFFFLFYFFSFFSFFCFVFSFFFELFLSILNCFFQCVFFSFVFPISVVREDAKAGKTNRREIPSVKMTISLFENSIFGPQWTGEWGQGMAVKILMTRRSHVMNCLQKTPANDAGYARYAVCDTVKWKLITARGSGSDELRNLPLLSSSLPGVFRVSVSLGFQCLDTVGQNRRIPRCVVSLPFCLSQQ